jgi:hypothetical protein
VNPRRVRRLGVTIASVIALTASVRATTPTGRYTITAGTVFDTKTKLTWQRTAPDMAYTWADAQTYCTSAAVSTTLGGAGRVPTIKELQTIIDYTLPASDPQQPTAKMDPTAFPGVRTNYYWSSTPLSGDATFAWTVNIVNGFTSALDALNLYDVRCVR